MELEQKVDPKHTAVLVIDMQNDFCSREGAYVQSLPGLDLAPIDQMVPNLARFLDVARAHDVPVIYVTAIYNTDDNRYLSPVWLEHAERRRQGLYTTIPLCKEGSWGAQVIDELAPREGEMVVVKHRYSAFIDTNLQAYLRNRGIKTILVTGVGTNGCVESTARDGFMLDHYTVTVSDCCSTYWREGHEAALRTLELLFGEVRESQDVIDAWNTAVPKAAPERDTSGVA
jgi:ureidoacrylate peracid hydrolase